MSADNNAGLPEQETNNNADARPVLRTTQWGWMLGAFVAGLLGKAVHISGGVVTFAVFYFLQSRVGPVNAIVSGAIAGVASGLGIAALLGQ
ncbi:hypothetical protein [Venatoribacter cucullus]|uniref:Uncharacterized protein n=1 Tax=Venatoribacter cucullus TaxID=2661630 RepID=A0A9E8FK20_9GAMM|nr:hypothetical protein [Venatoribacter cucullus]QQD21008.1 hypothetical protein GJQ54_04145 [Oceanospirillaceae bacterium ASx5O]QQD23791.1 hypothetical protein GJQ55_04545 [Venatoribacter cucullus]UZK03189.1 hypothetical protein GAY96_04345 [Venatoribacter cucullus]